MCICVNLNPDTACNFDCIYCQVDRTVAPRVRKVDVARLGEELAAMLELSADPYPDLLHEALEMGGVIVPSPVSAVRISYLRALGLDDSQPERYLGLFLGDGDSMVEVEIVARELRKLLMA